jgi:Calcineurin-like phosphoesterase
VRVRAAATALGETFGHRGSLACKALAGLLALGLAGPGLAAAPPASPQLETRVFLIGDAGDPDPRGEPVLAALGRGLSEAPDKSLAVFLGDNVYPSGVPGPAKPDRAEAERRLDAQVDAVLHAGARGLFIPGNHDWDRHRKTGWARLGFEEQAVLARGAPAVSFLPTGGCPGPAIQDLGEHLRLVVLDTQWWLQNGPKPVGATSPCPAQTEAQVVELLAKAVAQAGARKVIVLAHHPLVSGGTHGGHFGLRDHLFPLRAIKGWLWLPLPVIGSAYPLLRQGGAFSQDVTSSKYKHMQSALEGALAPHPAFIWAAGHDHGLQVLEGRSATWLLVSGGGIYGHTRAPARLDVTRFRSGGAGFMRLDVDVAGHARLAVVEVDKLGRGSEAFTINLD